MSDATTKFEQTHISLQLRSLLLPGIHMHWGDREREYTEADVEAVMAAFLAAEDDLAGIEAATAMMHRRCRPPGAAWPERRRP